MIDLEIRIDLEPIASDHREKKHRDLSPFYVVEPLFLRRIFHEDR